MNDFKSVASSVRTQQKLLNELGLDNLLAINARPEFEEYYSNFRFGFGSNWMKPLFKNYFWWGYFAGYKRGMK